jgi:hypothetical protein
LIAEAHVHPLDDHRDTAMIIAPMWRNQGEHQ